MMELLNGIRHLPRSGVLPVAFTAERQCTVDSLDSVWLGMKLGVAMIGMVMMRFAWRGIWRSKRVGDHKNR